MKVTTETLPERQVRLQIEVDDERHAHALEAAYKKLASAVRVPGFRPGKAPRQMIEKQIGRHRLLDEAMDLLLPDVYREAIDSESLDPVAQPSVELVSHEPLVFAATVPLMPVIDLGDYTSIRVPKEPVEVKEEQVEESLMELRRRYGTIEPVERAAKKGDIIRGNLTASTEDSTVFTQDDLEYRLTDESLTSLPGLADAIVGLKKGDEVEKTAKAPDDFDNEQLAGKTLTYKIKVDEVKEEKLANADDAFAKEVGEGFETLKALRDRIREDIEKAEQEEANHNVEHAAVDKLVDGASIEYPSVLVEREIDHLLEDQANLDPRDPRAQLLYLQRMNQDEATVRESLREEAAERLRRSLVLSQFAEAENIDVDDGEIDAELQKLADSAGDQAEAILRVLGSESSRESLRRSLHTRKTLNRLVEIASEGAPAGAPTKQKRASKKKEAEPEAATAVAEKKPPAKQRRSTPRKAE